MSSPVSSSIPICIDSRMLVPGATGVGTYARSLFATLPLIGGEPTLLVDDAMPAERLGRWRTAAFSHTRTVVRRADPDGERLHGRHIFAAAQARFTLHGRLMRVRAPGPPGIMHWTYPVPLFMSGWTNIYTVHDVIPIDHPELSLVDPVRLRAILNGILRVADHIVTVSETSRSRFRTRFDYPADRITDAGQSVAPARGDPDLSDVALLPDGLLPDDYYLYCGLVEPRKNVARLVAAHRASGVRRPLVIAGPAGVASDQESLLSTPGVLRLPYMATPVLAALQRHARALLFPSLAEGFGLPVVEAMALGTPVLVSDIPVFAEVVGDAALRVDPLDIVALADAIARLDHDHALREALSRRGRVRAARFTPTRFAARLQAIYGIALAARAQLPEGYKAQNGIT